MRIVKFVFLFLFITAWIYVGWPQVSGFPPEINKARAVEPIPAYRASGTFTAGTGAITPPYPAKKPHIMLRFGLVPKK